MEKKLFVWIFWLFVLALALMTVAGCSGATITFQPVVSDGYYPPAAVYYHRHRHYGYWTYRHYHGILVCDRYQGCTWR